MVQGPLALILTVSVPQMTETLQLYVYFIFIKLGV